MIYIGKAKDLRAGPEATSLRRPPKTSGPRGWCGKSATSISSKRKARSMPCSWRRGSSRTSCRNTIATSATTRRFPTWKSAPTKTIPASASRATPQRRGSKLYGPFTNSRAFRGAMGILQKVFKFRTCPLEIEEGDPRWRWFRPCLLASTGQCSAPCNLRISREEYRKNIHRLQHFFGRETATAVARCAKTWPPRPRT